MNHHKDQTLNTNANANVNVKIPVVELSDCILCSVCVECCPEAFRLNEAGYIEVLDLADYPEKDVNEAIKNCPADCIHWHEELTASD